MFDWLIALLTALLAQFAALEPPALAEAPPAPEVEVQAPQVEAPPQAPAPSPPAGVEEVDIDLLAAPPCAYEDGPGPCYWDASVAGNGEGMSFYIMPDGSIFYDEQGVEDGYLTPDWEVICPLDWTRSWDGETGTEWSACM